MRLTVPIAVIVFLMLAVAVVAPSVPNPVSGFIDVFGGKAGYRIDMVNLESGGAKTAYTDMNGGYIASWGNDIWKGDRIRITVAECSGYPACHQTLTFGEDFLEVPTFNILQIVEPKPCPSVVTCDSCCPADTTPYAECDSCAPACPDCPLEASEENCEEYFPEPEECPEQDWSLDAILAALIVVAAVGSYFFGSKKGKEDLKKYAQDNFKKGQYVRIGKYWNGIASANHLHRGIVGYHEPDTVHKDSEDRHPSGTLAGKDVPGD